MTAAAAALSCVVPAVTVRAPRDVPAPCCAPQDAKGAPRSLTGPPLDAPLGLTEALRLVLARNPALAAAERGRCVGAAWLLEARRIPNPELHVDVEDWLGSGSARGTRMLQLTVQVSQDVELGGKRRARVQVARVAARTYDWTVAALRLDLLARATLAFLDVLHGQELVGRQVALEANAARVLQDLSDKEAAGRVLEPVVAQARIRFHLAKVERQRAGARLEEARLILAGYWGGHTASFPSVVGTLSRIPETPSLESLLAASEDHPSLRAREATIATERARLEAERRAGWPDLALRAGYRFLNGEEASALVLGVSLPLPLFARNQGAVEEARVRTQRARLEHVQAVSAHRGKLVRAHGRLRSLVEEARTLVREVLPSARQSFSLLEEGFRAGRVQSLELLEAARTLIEVEERTLGARHQAHRALVELKLLAGFPLLKGGPDVPRSALGGGVTVPGARHGVRPGPQERAP